MKTLKDLPDISGTRVLVRAPMNVPIENGAVVDDYRLRRAAPTLRYLAERGARVIVLSHIGRHGTETLAPAAEALGKLVPRLSFIGETVGGRAQAAVEALLPGEVLVLENLRRQRGETDNDPAFAAALAALGDLFVQDSFDTCHRAHASIVGVPKLLPSYAGLLLEEEVSELTKALAPAHPALAAIGGAKFVTKEAVLAKLLATYDHVFVGGALANDFFRAADYEVGKSFTSATELGAVAALLQHPRLVLPSDLLVVPAAVADARDARSHARVAAVDAVGPDEVILDAGPETAAALAALAKDARTILWNGPFGKYENGFADATDGFAAAVAESGAHSILGGGDTVAAVDALGLLDRFTFVSTGGGAMLDLLADGTLPGITALG
jgi:phosphoglycerate kinase